MRVIWNNLKSSSRPVTAVMTALLCVLTLGLVAAPMSAQVRPRASSPIPANTVPSVLFTQVSQLAAFPAGGGIAGADPAGSTFAVNQQGNIVAGDTYGNDLLLINGQTGAVTKLVTLTTPYDQVGPVVVDSQNNIFFSAMYSGKLYKVPYLGPTLGYATVSPTGTSTPCTGIDTTECLLTNVTAGGSSAVVSMAFDLAGDLFYAEGQNGGGGLTVTNSNSIWECTQLCILTGTPAPVMLFQEPVGDLSTTGQFLLGAMSVDPYGDLFFTDAAVNSLTTDAFVSSNLKELVLTGTTYATTPTTLYTFTDSSPGQYDDNLGAVTTDANGTVYFGALYDGIYAFPSNMGVITATAPYAVSTLGAKELSSDSQGNLYVINDPSGTDTVFPIALDNVTLPSSPVGTAVSTPTATSTAPAGVKVFLNDGSTSSATVTISATEGGTATTEFTGTAAACVATNFGTAVSCPATITFTPAASGARTATLTATDTAANTGTATVSGTGIATTVNTPTFAPPAGTYPSTQTVAITSSNATAIYYTTNGTMPSTASTLYTAPITVSASETITALATASGLTSSTNSAAYVIAPAAATPTFLPTPGAYTGPQMVTISSTTAGATIYYTTDGVTPPTTSSTMYSGPITVSSSETIMAIATATNYANSAVATGAYVINSATGPVSAFQNVVMSQVTYFGPLTGGGAYGSQEAASTTPAVNAAANIFFVSTGYGGNLLEFNTQTGALLNTIPFNVGALAVDPQGNLYIGDEYDNNIFKVPFVSGAYAAISSSSSTTCTGTGDTSECVLPGLSAGVTTTPNPNGGGGYEGMAFDKAGDLFFSTQFAKTTPAAAIFEATAASLATGTPTATVIYQEPTSSTAQLYVGGLAADQYGDVFFTDSEFPTSADAGNEDSFASNIKELVYTAGTGYSTTPTTLYAYTNSSPAGYDNFFTGVAVDASGTVYFADQQDGIFAMPATAGIVNTSAMYTVSTQGAKEMTSDGAGNFYIAVYSNTANGDAALKIGVDNLTVPAASVGGAATTASVTTILNDGTCSAPETLTYSSSNSAFSATASTTCASAGITNAGTYATTVSFAPTGAAGPITGTLTATDSDSNSGTAAVSGTATVAASTPQTITFTAPTSPVSYGVAPITLSATASSGLAVTFSVTSGPGTISGDTLTVTGVGTILVAANQAGNSTYAAAPTVSQSVVVNAASQTITFTAPTSPVNYGVAPITLSATASSGLAVTFSVTSGPGTISGNTLTVTGVGTIVVAADQAGNADYTAAPTVSQSIVVNTGSQTITFAAPTSPVSYGVAPITLTATASSGLAVTFSVTSGPGTISGNTLTVTGVGTIVVAANQAGNTDYSAAPTVSQSIVVNAESQTITFTAPTSPVSYGVAPITLSATASSGLAVTFSVTSGPGTISGNTLTVTGVGTIVVAANQAGNADYAAAPAVSESIVVNAESQTITFTPPTTPVTYGVAPITLTATASSGLAVTFSVTSGPGTVSGNTLTVTGAGTIVVAANQAGNADFAAAPTVSETIVVNAPANPANFTIAISPSALTVDYGSSGSVIVSITPEYAYSAQTSFACSGLPAGASCTFSPSTVTPTGSAVSTTTLTVTAPATSAAIPLSTNPLLPGATIAAAALCMLGFRKRRRLQMLLMLMVGVAGLSMMTGCFNGSSSPPPAITTSTVTVTATSASISNSATFSLTVQ
jgi:hypothetical protein